MRGTRSYKGRRRPDSVWVMIVLRAFKVRKCVCREKVAVPGSLAVTGVVAVVDTVDVVGGEGGVFVTD